MDNTEKIRAHFEEEAYEFDQIILKLIPYYEDMVKALVNAIPFDRESNIRVIDLGCGTGTVSLSIKKAFPNARITCLDIASNMIEMAKIKLKDYSHISYAVGDFASYVFDKKYDVVVSSLDRPSKLMYQLDWLRQIGFGEVDVPWKYYNFAVYGGR